MTDGSLDPAPLGVAAVGNGFMGRAHPNPLHNVRANFDVPSLEQRVLVGRDKGRVREATPRCGWHDSATDWRSVIERDDIQIVDICGPSLRLWSRPPAPLVLQEYSPWCVLTMTKSTTGPSN